VHVKSSAAVAVVKMVLAIRLVVVGVMALVPLAR
jgi:hypothetical protein